MPQLLPSNRFTPPAPSPWHAALIVALLGMQACASESRDETPPPTPKEPSAMSYTVVLNSNAPSVVEDARLTLTLLEVKDERCPTNVRCVWAGHAAITLQVASEGAAAETIVIGTEAPANMHLPRDADAGDYHFELIALDPQRASSEEVALAQYRATVQLTRFER